MAHLDLKLPAKLSPAGRPAQEIHVSYVRDLTEQDLLVAMTSEIGHKPKPLQRLRAAHHNIAILLSKGNSKAEVSRITGRSISNIDVLLMDPAFKTLLAHYEAMGAQALADVHEQLSSLGQAALAALQEDLETDPDSISAKDKIAIAELAMDRIGHGPSKTIKTLNTKDAIKELVERKQKETKGQIIDVSAA